VINPVNSILKKGVCLHSIKILLLVLLLSQVFTVKLFSQQDSTKKIMLINKDTVEIGNYYSFYIANKEAFLGKVIAFDKSSILIYFDGEIQRIDIMDIVMIQNPQKILFDLSVSRKKVSEEKAYWMFSGGYIFKINNTNVNNTNYYYGDGFCIGGNALVTFSDNFGLRADLDFMHISRDDNTSTYGNYNGINTYYVSSGGALNGIFTNIKLVFGYLNSKSPINIYFSPGLGMGCFFESARSESYYENNVLKSTWSYTNSDIRFSLGIGAGLGASLKIKNNIDVYAEYSLNTWTYDIGRFNILRAGVIIRGK